MGGRDARVHARMLTPRPGIGCEESHEACPPAAPERSGLLRSCELNGLSSHPPGAPPRISLWPAPLATRFSPADSLASCPRHPKQRQRTRGSCIPRAPSWMVFKLPKPPETQGGKKPTRTHHQPVRKRLCTTHHSDSADARFCKSTPQHHAPQHISREKPRTIPPELDRAGIRRQSQTSRAPGRGKPTPPERSSCRSKAAAAGTFSGQHLSASLRTARPHCQGPLPSLSTSEAPSGRCPGCGIPSR
jgi:hypothetical protein